MVELKEQISVYLDHVVDRVDIETVGENRVSISVEAVSQRTGPRGIWIAVAVGFAVLILFGVVSLFVTPEETAPAATRVPPTLSDAVVETTVPAVPVTPRIEDSVVTTVIPVVPSGPANPEVIDVIDVGGFSEAPVAADGAIWQLQRDRHLIRIDPATLQVTDTIPVGVDPNELFPTEDGIWVFDDEGGELLLVDTSTRQVVDSIEIVDDGDVQASPVLVGQTLWVRTNGEGPPTVVEVDLITRTVVSETRVGRNGAWWAEEIDGVIWSYAPSDGLRRFDLETYEVDVFDAKVGYSEACCLTAGNAIWMVQEEGTVMRFDLDTLEITDRLEFDGYLDAGVVAAGAIWIPSAEWDGGTELGPDGSVYRIDLESREVTDVIPVGSEPRRPAYADGAIWVANRSDGTVSRIDVETRQVTHTIQVGDLPYTPWVFDGAIWVPNLADGTITIIKTR